MRIYRWFFLLLCCVFCVVPIFGAQAKTESENYRIKISCADNLVQVLEKTDQGEKLVKVFLCSVGPDTPAGTFYTSEKFTWRYLFGDVYGQYATRITGNILFHSVPYHEQDPSTLEYEEYNQLGAPVSMGCIRLRVCDTKWIYDHCAIGTEVTIQAEPFVTPLPQPEVTVLDTSDEARRGWDPTDPDPQNPWRSDMIFLDGVACSRKEISVTMGGKSQMVSLWQFQGRNYGSWDQLGALFDLADMPYVQPAEQVVRFLSESKQAQTITKTDQIEQWSLVYGNKAMKTQIIWKDGVPYFSIGDLALLFDRTLVWMPVENSYVLSKPAPKLPSLLSDFFGGAVSFFGRWEESFQ